jgi:predicted membrane chloride channel (bestrophin family)
MKKMFNSLLLIINFKTLIISILSIVATYFCDYFKFIGDLPITLIGTAIIFPVVFSINSAYKRREDVIVYYASFKSNLLSIFLASKNWVDKNPEAYITHSRHILLELMDILVDFFIHAGGGNNKQWERRIYQKFDELSVFIQTFRQGGVTPSELSRLDQYLTRAMNDFEKMKKILYYRTPNSLRTYSMFFIYTFPILYAPYFAHHLSDGNETIIGYVSAVLYSFVFVSLINIQEQLENPFDQFGEDDIKFDSNELAWMMDSVHQLQDSK